MVGIQGVSREVQKSFPGTEKLRRGRQGAGYQRCSGKEKLGRLTREKKVKVSMDDLKREWLPG